MPPIGLGLVDETWSGSMSQVLYCLVLVQAALYPLVVYNIVNHLNQAPLHPVGGEVLCAQVCFCGLTKFIPLPARV